MSVLSKLSSPTVLGAGLFLTWAAWYDHHRRSRPDYLDKLVERRKSELLEERKRNDPLYHVKNLPLCTNSSDPMAVQQYAMELMTEGEGCIEKGDKSLGSSKIALGLAYFPAQQIQMIMMQLAQSLPQDIVIMIRDRLNVARGRVQTQRIEAMMGANAARQAESSGLSRLQEKAAPVITEKPKDEEGPDDVDSIDGDSEERVVEVGEVKEETTMEEVKVEELPEDESQEEKIVELEDVTELPKPSEVEEKISEAINEAQPESELPPSANPTHEEDTRETAELLAQEQELVQEVTEEDNSQSEPEVLQAEPESSEEEEVAAPVEQSTGAGDGQAQAQEKTVVEEPAKSESLELQEEEDLD